ncbi:MAG: cupin domain-containing protein [Planctomycetota bacterium]
MDEVKVEKATPEKLKKLGVDNWSPWECEPSTFDWHYDEKETFYVKEGKVTVKHADGEVNFGAGDIVTLPEGMDCTWTVHKTIRKVYKMG